ncbi:hypothetical protein PIB30_082155 [Stylosanthes scabra]|uniref:Uncharacterized protein n=1 Tax=Stylosanthes scabra TaxID=79078 RepID=A0ABU6WUN4_9FABA|nr:hypothetical protein [Stylosanthes scabra]
MEKQTELPLETGETAEVETELPPRETGETAEVESELPPKETGETAGEAEMELPRRDGETVEKRAQLHQKSVKQQDRSRIRKNGGQNRKENAEKHWEGSH